MTIDQQALRNLTSTLELDGYLMNVEVVGSRVRVTVSAKPGICDDCLVPKPLMLSMLEPVLGVVEGSIDLQYPVD